jgi:uncharacterized delta-60 repeat protein
MQRIARDDRLALLRCEVPSVVNGGRGNVPVWRFLTEITLYTVEAINDAPTFSVGDGKVTTAIGSSHDLGHSVALQSDGKILVAGDSWNGSTFDFALVRYNADGSLDTSFSGVGKITTTIGPSTSDFGYSVTLQADGKILVAGSSSNESN